MDILKIMGLPEGYCTRHRDMPNHLQTKAKPFAGNTTRPPLRKHNRELKSYSSFSAPAIP